MTVQGFLSAKANAASRAYAMPRIAVIGRGFSGMMMAIALMKTVRFPFHLQLFDPNSSVSGGQALASGHSSEILNSRVRDLSVSAGDPDDFNQWLCGNAPFAAPSQPRYRAFSRSSSRRAFSAIMFISAFPRHFPPGAM